MISTEDAMLLLFAVSAHVTVALFIAEHPALRTWFITAYRDSGNGVYEYFLELSASGTAYAKPAEIARTRAMAFLKDTDRVIAHYEKRIRKENLLRGSWVGYLVLCVAFSAYAASMKYQVQHVRSERMRKNTDK